MNQLPTPAGAIAVRAAQEIGLIRVAPDQEAEAMRQAADIIQRAISEAKREERTAYLECQLLLGAAALSVGGEVRVDDGTMAEIRGFDLLHFRDESRSQLVLRVVRTPSASTAGTKETTL